MQTTPDPDLDLVIAHWSLTMMQEAFRNLALSFATIDADAADRAIHAIETLVAGQLTKFADHPPEGIVVRGHDLVPVAQNFREMTQGARQAIRDSRKPRN